MEQSDYVIRHPDMDTGTTDCTFAICLFRSIIGLVKVGLSDYMECDPFASCGTLSLCACASRAAPQMTQNKTLGGSRWKTLLSK